jgi:beta-glucanase (GH16 family)
LVLVIFAATVDVMVLGSNLIDKNTLIRSILSIHDNRKLDLVMSDEFSEDDRSFGGDNDLSFEAIEKPDNSNEALQFYNSSKEYVTTKGGHLVITTRAEKTSWMEWDSTEHRPVQRTKNYTSGMVQSWNKFCFTGGVLEIAINMPGAAGLWPAAWLMGNLARATFDTSTMYIWPWSYNRCDGSVPDLKAKQEINACDSSGGETGSSNNRHNNHDDDPGRGKTNPSNGLHAQHGRGAPEIGTY